MLSYTEPRQEELAPDIDEVEWPGELPDYVEEWNQFFEEHTISKEDWAAYAAIFGIRRKAA